MNENSKLFPESIRAQCDAIITKLEEDNEFLRQARVAMGLLFMTTQTTLKAFVI